MLCRFCSHRATLVRRLSTAVDACSVKKRVVFSGIQPTGVPHLGNYLGALKLWVDLQSDTGDIFYSIVDLHALTVPREKPIYQQSLATAACLLACGVDPKRCVIFKQSDVPEHGALSWVLSCLVQQSILKHMIQWKEKSKANRRAGNLGLFTYPILQCADILLYKATHVPVGEDQKQHLELCQEVAKSFNREYGDFFDVPECIQYSDAKKIKSLRDPLSKMSKSDRSELGKINLTDSDDEIWLKIKRAITDNTSSVTFEPKRRPGVSNLIQIHSCISGMSVEEICSKSENLETGQYKMAVAERVIDHIRPIRTEYEKLITDRGYVEKTVLEGGRAARVIAATTWDDVTKLIGLHASH